jgi:hypothetical protein
MSNKEYNIGEIVHYIKDNSIDTGVVTSCEGDKYLVKDSFNRIIMIEKKNAFSIVNNAWKKLHSKK